MGRQYERLRDWTRGHETRFAAGAGFCGARRNVGRIEDKAAKLASSVRCRSPSLALLAQWKDEDREMVPLAQVRKRPAAIERYFLAEQVTEPLRPNADLPVVHGVETPVLSPTAASRAHRAGSVRRSRAASDLHLACKIIPVRHATKKACRIA
jgi:hypothetical protein